MEIKTDSKQNETLSALDMFDPFLRVLVDNPAAKIDSRLATGVLSVYQYTSQSPSYEDFSRFWSHIFSKCLKYWGFYMPVDVVLYMLFHYKKSDIQDATIAFMRKFV